MSHPSKPAPADRRKTYVLERDERDADTWHERDSYPSSRRLTYVPVPSTPEPVLESDDSFIDGWFVGTG